MHDEIDLVITKSISRFARNTLDTLRYVRMLKEKNVAVFFEKKDFDTAEGPILRDFSAL
jgi:DNA invertase Pin-like site-specific DNA recombinase